MIESVNFKLLLVNKKRKTTNSFRNRSYESNLSEVGKTIERRATDKKSLPDEKMTKILIDNK